MSEGEEVLSMKPSLGVSRIKPGYVQVAEQIKDLIVRGELKVNQKLPSEGDLCLLFGVSRATVREALRVLSSQNLIVTTRGTTGGSFIAHPSPSQVSEYLEGSFGLLAGTNELTIEHLLEARIVIEAPAAGLAAKNRNQDQLAKIESLLKFDPDSVNPSEVFCMNWDFHLAIIKSAGNSLIEVMASPLTTILRSRFVRDNVEKGYWRSVLEKHQKIFLAIRDGDAYTAEAEMRAHLSQLSLLYPRIDRDAVV